MDLTHSSAEEGHSGYLGSYQKAKTHYWPSMKAGIKDFVASCDVLSEKKGENSLPAGLLQPLPIPEKAWQHITIDFIEGLLKSKGKKVILVVVNRLTKYSYFIGLSNPFTAYHVVKAFMDQVYKLHGILESIISDKGSNFLSNLWQELFKLLGTKIQIPTFKAEIIFLESPFTITLQTRTTSKVARGSFASVLTLAIILNE